MSLAELVDHVIGVDPDRDRITAAVVCTRTQGEIASKSFATTARGHGHGHGGVDPCRRAPSRRRCGDAEDLVQTIRADRALRRARGVSG